MFEKGYNFMPVADYQLAPNTCLHTTYQNIGADFMNCKDVSTINLSSLSECVLNWGLVTTCATRHNWWANGVRLVTKPLNFDMVQMYY